MPLIRNHAAMIPGGVHVFTDPTGVTLKHETIDGLLADIARYRTNNGMPPGDPERELERLYKVKYPWMVSKTGPEGETPLLAKETAWLGQLWRNAPKEWANKDEVDRRKWVCQGCEHFRPNRSPDAVDRWRIMVLGRGRGSPDMGICHEQGWYCGLAILFEKPEAKAVKGCWIRPPDAPAVPADTASQSTGH